MAGRRLDAGELLLKHIIGDVCYDPKRAALYLGLGAAALGFWIFSPPAAKRELLPVVSAFGSVALLWKGVFLLRKPSALRKKSLKPAIPQSGASIAGQLIQDFGSSAILLGLAMHVVKDVVDSWADLPGVSAAFTGAGLLVAGWLVRRYL